MILLVFESTHDALTAEQLLESKGYKQRIIPTPRAFSTSCGLSIRVTHNNGEELKELLASNGITNSKFTECEETNGKMTYGDLR